METCAFCDVWGSAANSESQTLPLRAQIETTKEMIRHKYKVQKFLVYFQAYTTTFQKIKTLEENFDVALSDNEIVGFVVGTRPDCLSTALIQMWQRFNEKSFVSVELGMQSLNEQTLKFYRRGHTAAQSLEAIRKIKNESSVDLGVHLIFGNPIESDEELIATAETLNDMKIQHVKLHHLHVLKKTTFEKEYSEKKFILPSLEEYCRRVGIFLSHLSPEIYVHRLAAYAPRWEELVAPAWTADKMRTHQTIVDYLNAHDLYQSKKFQALKPYSVEQTQVIRPT